MPDRKLVSPNAPMRSAWGANVPLDRPRGGMRDVRVLRQLAEQHDIIAWWQLFALGWSPRRIEGTVQRWHWQVIHDGVYAAKYAPLSRIQRWIAATLTQPATLLAGPSAGACWGFRPWETEVETVVRWGDGGPRLMDGVRVSRSRCLADDVAWLGPIPLTSVERTLIDLAAAGLANHDLARATRE